MIVSHCTLLSGTQWFFNGKLLEDSVNTAVEKTVNGKNTGIARVTSVSSEESGTYSCSCFNQAEFKTFIKNVYVSDEREPIKVSVEDEGWGLVGSRVSIACTAEGVPRPDIEWYKSGSKVMDGVFPRAPFKVEYEREMFKTIGYLVVTEGEFDDSGVFECKAFHRVKDEEFSETITSKLIIAKPTSSRIKCLDTVVEEGKTATLICAVSGVPQPTTTYEKENATDGSLIPLPAEVGTVNGEGYFIIEDLKSSDAGVYRGWATNVDSGGLLGRYDTMNLYVTPLSTRMSMNAIIGIAVLVAFLLIGGLLIIIFVGRWRRETAFKSEMKRLIRERDEEVNELQQKLQLRSMEHVTPAISNPLHQLPETRRQMPSFYAANIAVMAATPSAKFLPPSLADLKKRKILSGSVIHERSTVSPSSVKTILSDVESPDRMN